MKYYIIAGEASGDLHGANLMKGIRQADENADFRFFGGDLMWAQGGELVRHYREMAFMGFFRVLLNIRTVTGNLQFCRKDILEYQPDAIIFIDFPGFNLRMAKYARKYGFRIFYYISPKVWAWNKSRINTIRKVVDRMFVIFPFEVGFYRGNNYEVEYLGNPLLDAIEERSAHLMTEKEFYTKNDLDEKPVIALLPGSRQQEIDRCLPEMLGVISAYPEYQFVIAGAPGAEPAFYESYTRKYDVKIIFNQTYDLLKNAHAAVVTSGTATLEAALMMVPEVVCYRTGSLTYHVGKYFVHIRFFSLVNLIMGREVVKELLQFNLMENISSELSRILYDKEYRENMLRDFTELRKILGVPGASGRVGKRMVDLISGSPAS